VNDWRDEFERRASRGVTRGADDIFAAASMAPYAELPDNRGRRRTTALVGAGVAAAAALTVGVVAVRAGDDDAIGDDGGVVPTARCTIFFEPGTTDRRITEVLEQGNGDPDVTDFAVFSQQDALAEFRLLFADQQELVDSVTAEVLPPSARGAMREPTEAKQSEFESRYDGLADARDAVCTDYTDGLRIDDDADCWLTMAPEATEAQRAAVQAAIEDLEGVDSFTYRDLQDAPVPVFEVTFASDAVDRDPAFRGQVGFLDGVTAAQCVDE
jgi:hypothetical protein